MNDDLTERKKRVLLLLLRLDKTDKIGYNTYKLQWRTAVPGHTAHMTLQQFPFMLNIFFRLVKHLLRKLKH